MTSHDVVARCRRIFNQRRVGHGGTLDPGATGVLVVALGRATRLLRFVSDLPKSYEGEVVLGTETSTLDDEGEVTARYEMGHVTLTEVRDAAARLVGSIEQVPPMVSAVKVGGRRLHELARKGVVVDRPPRPVTVYRFDVEPTNDPLAFRALVDCSSGTYIRVLAADLGQALGGGAHLRKLRRTAVGPFCLDQAQSLDRVGADRVLPPAAVVGHLAQAVVDGAAATSIMHGAVLDRQRAGFEGEGPWAVCDSDGGLLAVYGARADGSVKPLVVLSG